MSNTLMVHFTWVTLPGISGKEEESLNGQMERSTTGNGKTTKRRAVESGKD